jgi:uncharacterized protein
MTRQPRKPPAFPIEDRAMATDETELPNFQEYAQTPATAGHASVKPDDKQWAMYTHMSALLGVPLAGFTFIGPILCWLYKRETSPFVDAHGKEAVNFQLNMFVPFVVTLILAASFAGVLFLLTLGVLIYGGVMAIMAGMKAGEGKMYRYPATIRVIN